jgi:hypothetical protein
MEKFRGRSVRTWSLSMGSMLLALTMTGCTTSPSWMQLPASQFPAKVQAVVFEDGTSLDRQHGVSWGNWTVSFGRSSPMASLSKDSGNIMNSYVLIEGLSCSNPVSGAVECQLGMAKYNGTYCFVSAPERLGGPWPLTIECPTALRFE